jgi:hypothetical protein
MPQPRFHRGTLLCEEYELRVTARCLRDDLGERHVERFEMQRAQRHEIVRAFCSKRSESPVGTGSVGPSAGARTLHPLRHGHDHRGATWFDRDERVVWLCACGNHRSGEADDAFQHFAALIQDGLIYPEAEDYERLNDDRAERFAVLAPTELSELRAAAEARAGEEVRAVIGGAEELGIVVIVVETLDELFVICSQAALADPTRVTIILVALCPDRALDDWDFVKEVPTRALRTDEIGFSIVRERGR